MRFPDNCVSHTAHIVMAMPTFSREEIVHLGDLARIALTDEEITRLQGELNVIADSINKVQEVASDDVPPTANPVPLEAYLRPDVAETPLTQEEALAGGPKTRGRHVRGTANPGKRGVIDEQRNRNSRQTVCCRAGRCRQERATSPLASSSKPRPQR
mgnify:CR=1 FL=1